MRILFSTIVFLTLAAASPAQDGSMDATPSHEKPFATFDAASEPFLSDPHDLVIGPDGRLYVADKFANRIAVLDRESLELLDSFGDGELSAPRDISFDTEGRAVIADSGSGRIMIYDMSGERPRLSGEIIGVSRTEGAVAHPNGRIYANSSGSGTITAFQNGEIVATAGGLIGAHDVEVGPNGDLWVADMGNRRIVRYSQNLEIVSVFNDAKYGFLGPRYLDVDEIGRVIVADQDAHRMIMIEPDGALVGIIGNGLPGKGPNRFDDPEGVAIYGSTYFFADSDNNRVVRYRVVMN